MRESGRGHVGIRVSRGDRDGGILARGRGRGHTGEVGGYWRCEVILVRVYEGRGDKPRG